MNHFSNRAISLLLAVLFLLGAAGVSFYLLFNGSRVFAVEDFDGARLYNPVFYEKTDKNTVGSPVTQLEKNKNYQLKIMVEESQFSKAEYDALNKASEATKKAKEAWDADQDNLALKEEYEKAKEASDAIATFTVNVGSTNFAPAVYKGSTNKTQMECTFEKNAIGDNPTTFGLTIDHMKYTGKGGNLSITIAYPSIGGREPFTRRMTVDLNNYLEVPVTSVSSSYDNYTDDDDDDDDDSSSKVKIPPPTPNIIVTNYDYGEGAVEAASTNTLSITFENTSNRLFIDNVIMKVTMPEAFTVSSSSNTFYIERMQRGQSLTRKLDFTVKPSAEPTSQTIKIDFSYESVILEERKSLTSEVEISIPVIQPNRFTLNTLEPPTEVYLGDDMSSMEATFINKGKGTAYNVTATIVGTNLAKQGQTQFIGNMESGKEESADFTIEALEAGEVTGEVIITFEDANMQVGEVRQSFSTMAIDMNMGMDEPSPDEMAMMNPEPVEEEKPAWYTLLPPWSWMTGGVVLAIVLAFCLKAARVNKQKKLEAEDADS